MANPCIRIYKTENVTWAAAVAAFCEQWPKVDDDLKILDSHSGISPCGMLHVKQYESGGRLYIRSKASSNGVCNYLVTDEECEVFRGVVDLFNENGESILRQAKQAHHECGKCGAMWSSSLGGTRFCPECGEEL